MVTHTATSPEGGGLDESDDAAHPVKDHGWSTIREDRVQFSDLRVRRAAEFIEASGIADQLQTMVTKKTGRPRLCTVQGLLVGMTLCSRRNSNGAVFFNQVTDIPRWAIPEHWRRRFKLLRAARRGTTPLPIPTPATTSVRATTATPT